MKYALNEVPVALEIPEALLRTVSWGDMTVETGVIKERLDPAGLFKGLPDDRCQCPHWGFVIKGALTFSFADRTETYRAGEIYYAEPGHLPVLEAGTEYVEFSPKEALAETYEVVERNMAAMTGA